MFFNVSDREKPEKYDNPPHGGAMGKLELPYVAGLRVNGNNPRKSHSKMPTQIINANILNQQFCS